MRTHGPTRYDARTQEATESRQQLATRYFADLYEAWQAKGKAVLDAVAMLYPDVFLRVVASHMPRETFVQTTITKINIDRISDAELDNLIDQRLRSAASEAETAEGAEVLQ